MVRYVKTAKQKWEVLWKFRYPALVLLLGLALLLLPGSFGTQKETPETEIREAEETFTLDAFTGQLETLLSGIQGAGEVKMLLSLETDGSRNYLANTLESQGDDAAETQTQTVLADVDGDDVPILLRQSYPTFRGAVVLCQGGGNAAVELSIKEAVSSLTGLGMDKITVLTMN